MNISKIDAIEANLDAAIEMFLQGNWVAAVHLAGAAEAVAGQLNAAKGKKTVPDYFWEKTELKDLITEKRDFVKVLNFFRDWIKHTNPEHDAEVELQEPHVVLYILRAVHAYSDLTEKGRPSVGKFLHWYEQNKTRLDEIVDKWPDGPAVTKV
ncbi:MAG: hypothetical protein SF172_17985 [Burkholderiales bacterium]|nr:hypothetical protein [Burkholderiales bacterium]